MARPRTTVGKLQRDQAKREKAKAKQEDRLARRADRDTDTPGSGSDSGPAEDQQALLAQFAKLHEDLAEGRISIDDFELRQDDLRRRLRVD